MMNESDPIRVDALNVASKLAELRGEATTVDQLLADAAKVEAYLRAQATRPHGESEVAT
jgi:hypothetical protein